MGRALVAPAKTASREFRAKTCRRWPRDRLNVDGGSVGLGHPVGMSGLRITIHLAHALKQRDLRLGAATVPAGSGLGTALLLERV